jgi:hypothetical protein
MKEVKENAILRLEIKKTLKIRKLNLKLFIMNEL